MKYIFLDIDGVLNCKAGRELYVNNQLNEKYRNLLYQDTIIEYIEVDLLRRLHEIVYKTGAVIVGVSSWFGLKGMKEYDEIHKGIIKVLSLPIYSIVDYVGGGLARGESVIKWLKDNKYNESMDSFIVIDDMDSFYSFKIRKIRKGEGLSENDVKHFIKKLNRKGTKI